MAKQGTSGRGGGGPAAVTDFNPSDFAVVEESHELSRSRTAPSELQPLIVMARENLGRKIERTVPVPATDGEAYELDDNGNPRLDEDGNPVPRMVRVPYIYKLAEAKEYAANLRNLATRNKLVEKGFSLRIVGDPNLAKATEEDEIRVQFYIIKKTPSAQTQEPAQQ